ncbi:hypothetical protein LAD77_01655 [Klebsiella pneumoniae]|nr:hypothetical protein [Klebsiella pneumoniae]
MDKHFSTTPAEKNCRAAGADRHLVQQLLRAEYRSDSAIRQTCPLCRLLQQGNMESNGKYVDRNGTR